MMAMAMATLTGDDGDHDRYHDGYDDSTWRFGKIPLCMHTGRLGESQAYFVKLAWPTVHQMRGIEMQPKVPYAE